MRFFFRKMVVSFIIMCISMTQSSILCPFFWSPIRKNSTSIFFLPILAHIAVHVQILSTYVYIL